MVEDLKEEDFVWRVGLLLVNVTELRLQTIEVSRNEFNQGKVGLMVEPTWNWSTLPQFPFQLGPALSISSVSFPATEINNTRCLH